MARAISDHQRRWLNDELSHWLSLGLIAPEQDLAIRACYETPEQSGQRKRLVASFALASLAAVLVGLGVLLLVSYNWQMVVAGWESLPRAIKLVAILAAIAAVQGTAIHLRRNTAYRRTADVLFLLGSLLYGGGIWLVAQVFHVNAHWPDGLWWWALGVLPLALLLDTVALHAVVAGLLAVWVGGEIFGFGRFWWGFIPDGCYSLPLLAAPGLVWSYRKGSTWAASLYVALLTWWVFLQGIAWGWELGLVFFIAMAGPMLLIVAENHRPGNPMSVPYRVLGTLLAGGGLVALSFVDFHRELLRPYHSPYSYREPPELMLVVVALAGLLAVTFAFSALLKPAARSGAHPLGRLVELGRQQVVPLAIAAAVVVMALLDGAAVGDAEVLSAVIANVAMVALAIWLIRTGLRDERAQAFGAGVLYLLLWAVIRYVDLLGSHLGMLGGAVMFIACGLGLFALATLWRKRKEICHVA